MNAKRIKVLHIIADLFSRGGTPRKMMYLVQNSDQAGFRHVFLVFANTPDNLARELEEAGATVIECDRRWRWDLRLLLDILHVARTEQVDIISTHFARADILGTIAGMMARKPVIQNIHGVLWNESRLVRVIDRLLASSRVLSLCNSHASRRELSQRARKARMTVVHDGIPDRPPGLTADRKASLKGELGLPPDSFVIGHIGGMIPIREQGCIIEALGAVLEVGFESSLLIIGDGPMRNQLERMVARLGLDGKVLMPGYREDIAEMLGVMDVYVNMTRAEGFGIAVVEAMLASLPVILADAGSHPELVDDGVSGILVPPGDVSTLTRAIMKIAADPGMAQDLGTNARTRALAKFAVRRYASEYERICRSVAEAGERR